MASLENVKKVIKKICSIGNLGQHVCFFGGAVPYIFYNEESNREHSDIDVLVDEKYMDYIRKLAKQNNIYIPKLDSLNLNLDDDYGFKVFIDGVYVEFEPMSIDNGTLIRKDFSPNKKQAGIEKIPFQHINDLIIELNIDDVKTYAQSNELIKISKEKYRRDKDLVDIKFIDSHGIDTEKYNRVKKSVEFSIVSISSYDELEGKYTKR